MLAVTEGYLDKEISKLVISIDSQENIVEQF